MSISDAEHSTEADTQESTCVPAQSECFSASQAEYEYVKHQTALPPSTFREWKASLPVHPTSRRRADTILRLSLAQQRHPRSTVNCNT